MFNLLTSETKIFDQPGIKYEVLGARLFPRLSAEDPANRTKESPSVFVAALDVPGELFEGDAGAHTIPTTSFLHYRSRYLPRNNGISCSDVYIQVMAGPSQRPFRNIICVMLFMGFGVQTTEKSPWIPKLPGLKNYRLVKRHLYEYDLAISLPP